ncbi:secreted protein [Beggiatoa sp. PS]|nr:secreted protein [Beggiatoa sp. PS]
MESKALALIVYFGFHFSIMTALISQSAIWTTLKKHQQELATVQIRDLFALDNQRFERFQSKRVVFIRLF